jgi:hypothetical protein
MVCAINYGNCVIGNFHCSRGRRYSTHGIDITYINITFIESCKLSSLLDPEDNTLQ